MNAKKVESFYNLKHGDKIISPMDNEVTGFFIDKDGDMFLESSRCLFPHWQFDPNDFYIYNGDKDVGEYDDEYFL